MKIDEYDSDGRERYVKLSDTVRDIMALVLKRNASINVQQIQSRAKDVSSLKKKMADRSIAFADELEPVIKDLAGCRVLLYTNADVERLLQSSAIRENFEIDWDRSKVHYPFDDSDADQLFVSYNYVIKLKEPRTLLPEYADLAGMYCELQIQTTLDHAWSEMAHDTIYKPRTVGFGTQRMQDVRKRMTAVMGKYLLPAGFDFQKIAEDVAELRAGHELYVQDPLKLLIEAEDNVQRSALLRSFQARVLPHLDDLDALAPRIRSTLMAVAKAGRTAISAEAAALLPPYSDALPSRIAILVCEILDRLRFLDRASIVSTFDCFCELHESAGSVKERDRIAASVKHLTEYRLDAWEAAGFSVQILIKERIEALSKEQIARFRPVILEALTQFLEPDIEGSTESFDAITIERGAVPGGPEFASIRDFAVSKVHEQFTSAHTDAERLRLFGILHRSTRFSSLGMPSAELFAIVTTNRAQFVELCIAKWPELSFEVRQSIEHNVLWLHRRRAIPDSHSGAISVIEADARLRRSIADFRAITEADADYRVFNALIGFNEVLPSYWNGDPRDQTLRNAEIARLVETIDEQSIEYWRGIIARCATSQSNDGAYFMAFHPFLERFAREKPVLAFPFLVSPAPAMSQFISTLLRGFEQGSRHQELLAILKEWIAAGRNLREVADYLWRPKVFDPALLLKVSRAATKQNDAIALHLCIRDGCEHVLNQQHLLNALILPGISELASHGKSSWVNAVAYSKHGLEAFEQLSTEQATEVLNALLRSPKLTYWCEEILARLALKYPQAVLDHFDSRILAKEADDAVAGYEVVPHEFHVLADRFRESGAMAVASGRRWFASSRDHFQRDHGQVIAKLYPNVADIEPALREWLGTGVRTDLEFVVDVLGSYHEGNASRSPLCREIVVAVPEGDVLLVEIEAVIDQMGMVSGEFGLVEARKERRDYLRAWLEDGRPAVLAFAKSHILDLERAMASEQRRSMERLQLRKRRYEVS